MKTNVSILPTRSLDETKRAAIKVFYTPGFVGIYLAILLPITLGLSLGGAFFGLWPGLIAGVSITMLLLLRRRLKIKNNIRKAEYVYEYGDQQTLRFTGISNNYSYKVNGAPQQVIALTIDGRPFEIRTFNANLIRVYTIPEQPVFTHPEYKNTLVPAGLFLLPQDTKPRSPGRRLRNALLILVPLAFAFGLTYFITSQMNAHSSTYAQPDALLYRQNGRLILASVFIHFQAYQIKNGTTYGSDSYYAEAVDLETGKKLWKLDLQSKDPRGAARLLGQSEKYLFFLRNDLFIVDKTTGKLAAKNNDLGEIKDKLSREPIGDYMQDAAYQYNDSLQALVIKGNDGLFYTIDGNTLHTATVEIADPNDYFKNQFKYGNNYEDQMTAMSDDGRHCLALLDTKDTLLLARDANGFETRPARESIRRQLYSTPATTNDSNWTTHNPAVFLFGGFLVEPGQRLQPVEDSLSKYRSYQDLASRFNHTNSPLRSSDGGYVILHKTTIEPDAPLVLTGISATGQTRWQLQTGFLSIPLLHHDAATNTLYIAGNNRGDNGDQLMQLTAIDLATGAIRQYPLK